MIIQTWQIVKTIWKIAGVCLLLFLICITHDAKKIEKFNNFGKQFGSVGEVTYEVIINAIFYGGILLCVADALL